MRTLLKIIAGLGIAAASLGFVNQTIELGRTLRWWGN